MFLEQMSLKSVLLFEDIFVEKIASNFVYEFQTNLLVINKVSAKTLLKKLVQNKNVGFLMLYFKFFQLIISSRKPHTSIKFDTILVIQSNKNQNLEKYFGRMKEGPQLRIMQEINNLEYQNLRVVVY
eukprot:TRINITY_DN8603_c1_g1_i3.p7 TRINITY_DN8603_c1_g1~~TRINITY_DN8603_c1_g1_i3.p7  ORF type:complete len:127 (+),score=4.37 TRINITY_DN8603_c1_g1_i3:1686-2066(+)